MKHLVAQLSALQAALSLPTEGAVAVAADSSVVNAYIRAIKRKAKFAEVHLAILEGIDWERANSLGLSATGALEPDRLSMPLFGAFLVIEHPEAVIDHVYLAFDGLMAALANMTDTLGGLIYYAYRLKGSAKRTSLFNVRRKCGVTSPLGIILWNSQNTDWLKKVRNLRGRCQHANVEEILISEAEPYSCRGQPYVDQRYSWSNPAQQTLMVPYAQDAAGAAENCMLATVKAILSCPQNPMK